MSSPNETLRRLSVGSVRPVDVTVMRNRQHLHRTILSRTLRVSAPVPFRAIRAPPSQTVFHVTLMGLVTVHSWVKQAHFPNSGALFLRFCSYKMCMYPCHVLLYKCFVCECSICVCVVLMPLCSAVNTIRTYLSLCNMIFFNV